jgi:hypothetical protein
MAFVAVCECGWRGKRAKSRAVASYAASRHRCSRFAILTARKAAAERIRTWEGEKRDCLHKVADHTHGSYACYVLDRCRCRPCIDAHVVYTRNREKEKAYGRWRPYVDAGPARQHCFELMAAGVGLKRIVKVSGVPQGVLWKLVYGKRRADGVQVQSRRVRAQTSANILAVPVDPSSLAGGARVPSLGSRLRCQELVALGWSQSKLAARLGMNGGNFGVMFHHRGTITRRTEAAVAALYDELVRQSPPEATHRDRIAASRARNYAVQRGWAPPAYPKPHLDPLRSREQPAGKPYEWIQHRVETQRALFERAV